MLAPNHFLDGQLVGQLAPQVADAVAFNLQEPMEIDPDPGENILEAVKQIF